MNVKFSERAKNIQQSAIRAKLFDDIEIISFAAGNPEANLFPLDELAPLAHDVILDKGKEALQYSNTEGILPLREHIAYKRMKTYGVDTTPDKITMLSGAQEGIELLTKIFINEGDYIACENPSYSGLYSAARTYSPKYIGIPMDEDGMKIDALEKALASNSRIKMIYTIPDYQNPTGIVMSDDRRQKLADLAAKYKIPVIEDRPYGDLYYEGNLHPTIRSFDKEGWVIMLGSFSKILCPGFRIGWASAEKPILDKLLIAKQAVNLQPGTLDQFIVLEYLKQYDIDKHIEKLRKVYKSKRDAALYSIEVCFPKEIKYNKPKGGFFIWMELNQEINTSELLVDAVNSVKVDFVPGTGFFANGGGEHFLRLNFSVNDPTNIKKGLQRLGALLQNKYY